MMRRDEEEEEEPIPQKSCMGELESCKIKEEGKKETTEKVEISLVSSTLLLLFEVTEKF